MPLVYADSPGSAFAMNANLDQQRVANYLNSIAQNRNAQQSSWEAAARMAAVRQAQEQQQQAQMIQLAQHAQQQRQQQEAENYGRQQDALKMLMAGRKLDLDESQQKFFQSQGSATDRRAAERATIEAENQAEEQATLARILPMINEKRRMDALAALMTPEGIGKLKKGATGAGFEPPASGFFGKLAVWNPNRSTLAKEGEIKDRLSRESFDLPVEPGGDTERLDAYVKRLKEGLDLKRMANAGIVPDASKVAGLVESDASGQLVPLRRNPLLTSGTATTPAAPARKPITPEIVLEFLNRTGGDRNAARALARAEGYAF